jgi:uncharacterized protein YndB with AHSA1/START domain
MTDLADAATRSIVIERVMPHPPEKIWRALTQSPLIEEWLMKNDFRPVVGHKFNFRADPMPGWNGVTDCEVLVVEPNERLSYSWNASGEEAVNGLKTVVTWTLTPVDTAARSCAWSSQASARRTSASSRAPASAGRRWWRPWSG